jgi:hypothetical protein
LRHFGEPSFRHGHGGERADADAVRAEHRADTADYAFSPEAAQGIEYFLHVQSQAARNDVERRGGERKAALEVVEQAELNVAHSPVLCARTVKKMPLGLCAGREPIRANESGS